MAKLAHDRVTAGEEARPRLWLYFLHGIYGRGRNWRSVARELVRRRPEWGGALLDLRLHGDSPGFDPPHTLAACAADVRALAEDAGAPGPPAGVLGHSFGGKVALSLLGEAPPGLRQAWIVDSTPSTRRPSGSAVEMLEAVRELPGPFRNRNEAIAALESRGFERLTASWMATNLEPGGRGLRWRLDPDGLEALLLDFFAVDLWDVVEEPPGEVELAFVKAEGSEVLSEEECRRIETIGRATGRVRLHRIDGGHWLNVDNPDALVRLLAERLPSAA